MYKISLLLCRKGVFELGLNLFLVYLRRYNTAFMKVINSPMFQRK